MEKGADISFNPPKTEIKQSLLMENAQSKTPLMIPDIKSGNEGFMQHSEIKNNSVVNDLANLLKAKISAKQEQGFTAKQIIESSGLSYDFPAELNNPSYLAGTLKGMDQDTLNFWKEEVIGSIDSVGNSTVEKTEKRKAGLGEWINKHKGEISFAQLGLYVSTFGTPIIKDLSDNHATLDVDGKKVAFEDVAKNPEFKQTIDTAQDIPTDVLQAYASKPLSNKDGFALNFVIGVNDYGEKTIGINMIGDYDVQGDAHKNQESLRAITDTIQEIVKGHASKNTALERMTIKEFEANREKLVNNISSAMNIPQEEISNHFDKLFKAVENPAEKITVVPLENFDIDKSFEAKGEIQMKYDEVIKNYNMQVPEEKEKAVKEFEGWGKEKGHDNVWSALSKEKLDNPFSALEKHETSGVYAKDIYGKFLSNELKERGYNLDELKKDNGKAVNTIYKEFIEKEGLV